MRNTSRFQVRNSCIRGRVRKEPVRFDSFRFRTLRKFIGSVRFGSVRKLISPDSTQFGLRFSDAPWLGPVGFGSFRVRFWPIPELNSSVRFGRFGSVSYSFLQSASTFVFMQPHAARRYGTSWARKQVFPSSSTAGAFPTVLRLKWRGLKLPRKLEARHVVKHNYCLHYH